MSRRHITYAALVVASFVLSACAQPMAPAGTDTMCRGGVIVSSGKACDPE